MNTIREDLKTGNLRRFYVLTGTEDYLRRVYLGRLSKAILPEEDTMNRVVFEGGRADPMEVLEAAVTLPFLAERRLLILRDTGWLKSSCALADHLDEIPETTYILFTEKELDKRNKIVKYIEEHGHIASFEQLRETDAVTFVGTLLKRSGLAITDADARLLVDITGGDLTAITNETDKLSAYCYGRDVVTREDILTLTTAITQGQMFRMVDAIVAKNRRAAVSLYRELLTAQTPPALILYNLINSFYQFSLVLRMQRKGLSAFDIGNQLKMNSYAVGKYLKVSKSASVDAVTAAVAYGAELEAKVKNGAMPDRMAVELFLMKQCGGA
ncbi:MAG: DNA polymerase III subunit delta [Lachnospiraceae bacterium]|nr:DNA polymerase III subunit delta [Lachnospiraceae bacterium]